jgi:predicted dehydrogenase
MTTSKTPFRLGLIGLQGFGATYFQLLRHRTDVTITAICDSNPVALETAQQHASVHRTFTNYQDLVNDPDVDAVCIATPHFLHHPMALAALKSSKHVFCEKPLTITARDADELVTAARAADRVLTCHYNQRVTPHITILRQAIRQKLLGEIYHINARWMARHTAFMFDVNTTWRQSRFKSGGGILIGRGSHLIDAALHLLDFPNVERIRATALNRLTGYEVDDFADVVLQLAGGITVSMQCSYVAHTAGYTEKIEWDLFGTAAGATFRQVKGAPPEFGLGACQLPSNEWRDLSAKVDREAARALAPASILEDFVDAARSGRIPFVTGEQAAYVTRLVEAAYRSSDTGREVLL